MTIGFKPFTTFILCCSNSSHASPSKDNTRSIIVLIKKLTDVMQLTLTMKTTATQVFKTSVTFNYNSLIEDYVHRDDHSQPTYEMTHVFKPFTVFILCCSNSSHASPLKATQCQELF